MDDKDQKRMWLFGKKQSEDAEKDCCPDDKYNHGDKCPHKHKYHHDDKCPPKEHHDKCPPEHHHDKCPPPDICPPGKIIHYKIKAGDTFFRLARRFGTTVEAIMALNPGVDPRNLQIGQIIHIPCGIPHPLG